MTQALAAAAAQRGPTALGSPQGSLAASSALCIARSSSLPGSVFSGGLGGELSKEQPSVYSLREARRHVDLEAQTLANRIALLRSEGEKACKRLDETRWRSVELESRPLKASEQEAFLRKRLQEIQERQRRNRHQRESGRLLRADVRTALLEGRRKLAREVKETSKQMQDGQKQTDEAMNRVVADRVNSLRERITGKEKTRMLEDSRLAQFQKNREERAVAGSTEVTLRRHTEKRITEMEQEEEDLLEWLQAKQLEQRQAYSELEAIAEARRLRSLPPKQ